MGLLGVNLCFLWGVDEFTSLRANKVVSSLQQSIWLNSLTP